MDWEDEIGQEILENWYYHLTKNNYENGTF